jgi:hypothetical protein
MPLLPRFLALSLSVIAALLASPANAADKIAMRFEVFGLAGLHVATDRTLIEENGASYAITGEVKTTGIAGMFQDFQKKSTARGRLAATGVQPETYSADVRRDKAERHDKIDFRANATASGTSSPAAKADTAAGPPRDAVDPLTAYFLVERRLGQGGNCSLTVPVFDGLHRYDLKFTDLGEQKLSGAKERHYSGDAHACKMTRENLAGMPEKDKAKDNDKDKVEMPQRGTMWYARLTPGDLMLPVKVELVTDIGGVTGHLAELHGRGADLKFADPKKE